MFYSLHLRWIFSRIVCSLTLLIADEIWKALQVYSPLSFLYTRFISKPSAIFTYFSSSTNSPEREREKWKKKSITLLTADGIKCCSLFTINWLSIVIPRNARFRITSHHTFYHSLVIFLNTLYSRRIDKCNWFC